MKAVRETARERLIKGLKFPSPEHYHCPECNTLLEPHSESSDYHYCPNCRRDFLILGGEVLYEVA